MASILLLETMCYPCKTSQICRYSLFHLNFILHPQNQTFKIGWNALLFKIKSLSLKRWQLNCSVIRIKTQSINLFWVNSCRVLKLLESKNHLSHSTKYKTTLDLTKKTRTCNTHYPFPIHPLLLNIPKNWVQKFSNNNPTSF